MYCEKCGNKIKEGAMFCDSCGSRVREELRKKVVVLENVQDEQQETEKQENNKQENQMQENKGYAWIKVIFPLVILIVSFGGGLFGINTATKQAQKQVESILEEKKEQAQISYQKALAEEQKKAEEEKKVEEERQLQLQTKQTMLDGLKLDAYDTHLEEMRKEAERKAQVEMEKAAKEAEAQLRKELKKADKQLNEQMAQSQNSSEYSGNQFVNYNNYMIEQDVVSVKPARLYYSGDELIAEVYIINGLNRSISVLNELYVEFSDMSGNIIAEGYMENVSCAVGAQQYVLKEFTFPANLVQKKDAALSKIIYTRYYVKYI